MDLTLKSTDGAAAGTISVADGVFGKDYNEALIHQVVVSYMAGARAGTKAQKTRADVKGGGAKPWRQKGTGRARAGSSNSPIWRSGGVTFAARPRDYSVKVNRKMYRGAMGSILSELVRQERLVVVKDFTIEDGKTKTLVTRLKGLGLERAAIITAEADTKLYLAARNVYGVEVFEVADVDPVSLVGSNAVVITEAAVKQLEEKLS